MNVLYLKEFREKYNIDRDTQAVMLDVTIDTLNNWEYRTKKIPKTKIKHIEYVFNTYVTKIKNSTINTIPNEKITNKKEKLSIITGHSSNAINNYITINDLELP